MRRTVRQYQRKGYPGNIATMNSGFGGQYYSGANRFGATAQVRAVTYGASALAAGSYTVQVGSDVFPGIAVAGADVTARVLSLRTALNALPQFANRAIATASAGTLTVTAKTKGDTFNVLIGGSSVPVTTAGTVAAPLTFGFGLSLTAEDKIYRLPTSTDTAANFAGIVMRTLGQQTELVVNTWAIHDEQDATPQVPINGYYSLLRTGVAYVPPENGCVPGQPVFWRVEASTDGLYLPGRFSGSNSGSSGGTLVRLYGAEWLDTVADGDVGTLWIKHNVNTLEA
jgi:hypothetical protein